MVSFGFNPGDEKLTGPPAMVETKVTFIVGKLERLRIELIDLAVTLEGRGRLDAADVAMTTSARVGELCDELAAEQFAAKPNPSPPATRYGAVGPRPPQ